MPSIQNNRFSSQVLRNAGTDEGRRSAMKRFAGCALGFLRLFVLSFMPWRARQARQGQQENQHGRPKGPCRGGFHVASSSIGTYAEQAMLSIDCRNVHKFGVFTIARSA